VRVSVAALLSGGLLSSVWIGPSVQAQNPPVTVSVDALSSTPPDASINEVQSLVVLIAVPPDGSIGDRRAHVGSRSRRFSGRVPPPALQFLRI